MSDRIDTEAVREAWPIPVGSPYTQGALAARTMLALCDEVDRLRGALRVIATGIVWGGDSQKIARAALGEQEAAPSKIEQELNYWRAKAAEYAYIIEQESISMEELAESLGIGEQEATPECTGLAATWCPVHGDCTCRPYGPGVADHKDDPTCPLHAPSSPHGEPVGEQEAAPPEPTLPTGWPDPFDPRAEHGPASAPQGEAEPPDEGLRQAVMEEWGWDWRTAPACRRVLGEDDFARRRARARQGEGNTDE